MKLKQQQIEDFLPEDYYNLQGEDVTSVTGVLAVEEWISRGKHLRGES